MKTSLEGCLSIIAFEGVILKTYLDSAGIPTIGIGHTKMAGLPVPVVGMTLSIEDAVQLLRHDLGKYEREVEEHISVPLSQNQFDALVSWHFNTGGVAKSTLKTKLNKGDTKGASKEFARWNKATINGVKQVLKGLTRRRAREEAIFVDGDYGEEEIVVEDADGKRLFSKSEFAKLIEDQTVAVASAEPSEDEELSTNELLANPSSSLLPNYRPRQSDAVSRATVAKFAHLLPEGRRSDAVYVLGIRGYYTDTMGAHGVNDRSIYDDAMFVIEPNGVHNFNANTDPSRRRRGIAQLRAQQAVRYKPGLHGYNRKAGPYPAFRQASACTVVRDGKGEDTDRSPNYFWINLHRGGNRTTSSAGCQTVPPNQWHEFRLLLNRLLERHGQKDFYYILVDEDQKAQESSVMPEPKTPAVGPANVDSNRLADAIAAISDLINSPDAAPSPTQAPPAPAPIPPATAPVPPATASSDASALTVLIAVLQQIEAARRGAPAENLNIPQQPVAQPTVSPPSEAAPLTPVNGALGTTLGKALNGKKTVLGTLGLLATTLIPAVAPAIPAIVPAAVAVKAAAPVALPVFSALTGWGVLGKIDKWFATRLKR